METQVHNLFEHATTMEMHVQQKIGDCKIRANQGKSRQKSSLKKFRIHKHTLQM